MDEGWGMRKWLVAVLTMAAVMTAAPADAGPVESSERTTTAALGRLSIPAIRVNAGIIAVANVEQTTL